MKGVDVVVHLAALLHIVNPSPQLREKYEKINVGGTASVIEAARLSEVKRVVFFSTISVYGSNRDLILDEGVAPQPDTFYAQTKLAAERIVLGARGADGQALGTVLRLAAVYGPRIKGNYERLLRALSRGKFIPIGDGYNRRTLIYERDVGRAAVVAAEHPEAAGRIYNVSDGQFHTLKEIIETMCEALGRKAPRFSIPLGPARVIAATMEKMARVTGRKSGVGRATLDKYTEDVAVDSHRIQKELGFVPKFDLKSGWRETVQEMRQAGQL
jgi:UDP-glucose 4-epimerase